MKSMETVFERIAQDYYIKACEDADTAWTGLKGVPTAEEWLKINLSCGDNEELMEKLEDYINENREACFIQGFVTAFELMNNGKEAQE